MYIPGLEKNSNSDLPFRQVALKCRLPWAVLSLPFFQLVGRKPAWALTHWASENEKLLTWQENRFLLHNCTALFLSPKSIAFPILIYGCAIILSPCHPQFSIIYSYAKNVYESHH